MCLVGRRGEKCVKAALISPLIAKIITCHGWRHFVRIKVLRAPSSPQIISPDSTSVLNLIAILHLALNKTLPNDSLDNLSQTIVMASTDDALETYTHLPLHIDPQTKQISILSSDKALQDAVANLNSLHASLKTLDTPNNIPPPPLPVNPKRSGNVQKLRESAAASSRKGQHNDAIRLLGVAIDMAAARPGWEPMGLAREELALMYLSRAAANAGVQNWVEGLNDAECSLECKKGPSAGPNGEKIPGNAKAFIVGARCLMEMGRWTDAVEWLERAIEIEGKQGEEGRELERQLAEAKARVGAKA